MPIRPENVERYPKDWKRIRDEILERAGHRCEECGVANGSMRQNASGKMVRIVLTIGHRDHVPEHCDPDNLRAWCQRCHNRYDAPVRAANRKARQHAASL